MHLMPIHSSSCHLSSHFLSTPLDLILFLFILHISLSKIRAFMAKEMVVHLFGIRAMKHLVNPFCQLFVNFDMILDLLLLAIRFFPNMIWSFCHVPFSSNVSDQHSDNRGHWSLFIFNRGYEHVHMLYALFSIHGSYFTWIFIW